MGVSLPHLIVYVLIAVIWTVPLCVLFGKAGYNRAWGLFALFPPLAIFVLWIIAFLPWRTRSL